METMRIEILGKKVKISEMVERDIEKKMNKLSRYLNGIINAKIEVYEEETKSPEQRFTIRVMLKAKRIVFTAEERGSEIYTATDKAVEVLTHQIERYKGKLYEKGKGISLARQGANPVETTGIDETKSAPKVVNIKKFQVKPMSLAEASEQMEVLGHSFYIFVNSESGDINLLYRRKDGNYGLIQSEIA